MQMISCHDGRLYTLNRAEGLTSAGGFSTGLAAIDALLPGGLMARGSVHELLSEPRHGLPMSFGVLLARAAMGADPQASMVWCDADGTLYPPAVAARGVPMRQFFLVRPTTPAAQLWSAAECLGCKGVAVTVAPLGSLSRVEARRLQLAAERGGGVGLLMRPVGKASAQHAATTRWVVAPHPGDPAVQRWKIQLIHGHGGHVGKSVFLEYHRGKPNPVRAVAETATDRAAATRAAG